MVDIINYWKSLTKGQVIATIRKDYSTQYTMNFSYCWG